jgi:GNAT superfamily N-acetyltransferase
MDLVIRGATTEDVPEIEQLIVTSVRALSVGYYTSEVVERALVQVFGVDTQLIADATYYVALLEGILVGCGGWSRRKTLFGSDRAKAGADDGLLDPAVDAARIRAFYVHPQWARRGIGSRILKYCEGAAHDEGFRRAELGATLPGRPLYAAYGYVEREEIRVDLGDGNTLTGFRMEKPLTPDRTIRESDAGES